MAALDARVATYDAQLAQVAQTHSVCQRLMTIPGLGEMERRGWNRAAVALANTNARVAWALMSSDQVSQTAAA